MRILLLLPFLAFITNSTSREAIPPPPFENGFILGAMSNYSDWAREVTSDTGKFGMNIWHRYPDSEFDPVGNKYYPKGWTDNDLLFAPLSLYEADVRRIIRLNESHNLKTLMVRPKILWLACGQRSDYQCEEEQHVDPSYWFYTFQRHNTGRDWKDNSRYGNGQWVRYCRAQNSANEGNWTDRADTVAARLVANNEQSDNFPLKSFNSYDDSQWRWLVKPSIRIDRNFANDRKNWDVLVCRVDVYNSDGYTEPNPFLNRIKSFDLRVRNFKKSLSAPYDGHYGDEFTFIEPEQGLWADTSTQFIDGAWTMHIGFRTPRGRTADDSPWPELCKSDIRVYWYGNCDMWIDRVRVDNEIADLLFKGYFEQPGRDWLKWEASLAGQSVYRFYLEEFELNHVPCLGYINRKLKEYTNPDAGMMACFYWRTFTRHLNNFHYQQKGKWSDSGKLDKEIIKQILVDSAGLDEFFTETYPFTGSEPGINPFSRIPGSLSPNNSAGECVLGSFSPAAEYDDWLQVQLDYPDFPQIPQGFSDGSEAGWMGWTLRLANDLSRTYGKPFINMPQVHQWVNHNIEVRREPTNEEIMLEANLSLSYGAKGLLFFWFGGFGSCPSALFGKGFMNNEFRNEIRYTNAYGQEKWNGLMKIFGHIRRLAPYFFSFIGSYTRSYAYHLERAECLGSTYFADVVSYKLPPVPQACSPEDNPGGVPPPGLAYECRDKRYLQAAVFKDINGSLYFMIVNRRCSPYVDESTEDKRGGRRFIRIRFDADHPDFAGFNKGKIINLEDNSAVVTFDKRVSSLLDLGWFMPGEGRLYKIAPDL